MSGLAFVDTETTGLDPELHQVWEVGLIIDDVEYLWQLPVDLGKADARALDIGGFHERRWREPDNVETHALAMLGKPSGRPDVGWVVPRHRVGEWAREFAHLTRGRHLVGAVVSFDEERLRKLLRANGACPAWHYHLIDVEPLALGWLAGREWKCADGAYWMPPLPWKSDDLSRAVGVEPPADGVRHTALGDAEWAKAIFEACVPTATEGGA